MKKDELTHRVSDLLGEIDGHYITEADSFSVRRRTRVMRVVAMAAAITLLAGALAISVIHMTGEEKPPVTDPPSIDDPPNVDDPDKIIDYEEKVPPELRQFDVKIIGGQYFMQFDDYTVEKPPSSGGSASEVDKSSLSFDSFEKLIGKIENHTFTNEEIEIIKTYFPRDDNGIKIFDFTKALYPKFPSTMTAKDVTWSGPEYSVYIESTSTTFAYLFIQNKDRFETVFNREYANFFENPLITVVEEKQISDRNATETLYVTSNAKLKRIRYKFTVGDTTYIVDEEYLLTSYVGSSLAQSDTVPLRVNIYGQSKERTFIVQLFNLEERPSMNFLKSFGAEPLK